MGWGRKEGFSEEALVKMTAREREPVEEDQPRQRPRAGQPSGPFLDRAPRVPTLLCFPGAHTQLALSRCLLVCIGPSSLEFLPLGRSSPCTPELAPRSKQLSSLT